MSIDLTKECVYIKLNYILFSGTTDRLHVSSTQWISMLACHRTT